MGINGCRGEEEGGCASEEGGCGFGSAFWFWGDSLGDEDGVGLFLGQVSIRSDER